MTGRPTDGMHRAADGTHRAADGAPRRPAHAGTFYPASPEALLAMVDRCVADAASLPRAASSLGASPVLGILVPHAGLIYSGAIAARGWKAAADSSPTTVVIAGTNHVAGWLRGAAVWSGGAWLTPLGVTRIDAELAIRIAELGGGFGVDREAHRREHSIEVQLPFLERLLPDATIVPIQISFDSSAESRRAGTLLGGLLAEERATGRNVVLAISSDLAHYPPVAQARLVDARMLEVIRSLDAEELGRRELEVRGGAIPGLVCGMCGIEPTLFGLAALREMGATAGGVLVEATSADVPFGDPNRTVGYAAVAFA